MPLTSTAFNAQDRYFFGEGTHSRLYDQLGCHLCAEGGARFAVWAPNAASVSVVGDWNGWNGDANPLEPHEDSGIWTGSACEVTPGQAYKYRIHSRHNGYQVDKADPFAFYCEAPPDTASRAWSLDYAWGDGEWMATRGPRNALDAPMSCLLYTSPSPRD